MWKHIVERCWPRMTIWRMRTACWITKARQTHSQYVIMLFHCSNGCTNAPLCYTDTYIAYLAEFRCRKKFETHREKQISVRRYSGNYSKRVACDDRWSHGSKYKTAPVHVRKAYWGSRCIAPLILSLGAMWRSVANITPSAKNIDTGRKGGLVGPRDVLYVSKTGKNVNYFIKISKFI